ncbi:hypothetical protein AA0229_2313 [Gluconobacter cerinus NRIC 0229]|nr:hypothetical protein AA0229_2313 [Gluconobacter cerinus NRIC 0229]
MRFITDEGENQSPVAREKIAFKADDGSSPAFFRRRLSGMGQESRYGFFESRKHDGVRRIMFCGVGGNKLVPSFSCDERRNTIGRCFPFSTENSSRLGKPQNVDGRE